MAFVKNEAGIGQMLVLPGMVEAMRSRAEQVAGRARDIAPVDEVGPHPGRYKAGFVVTAGVRPRDQDPPRARIKHARAYGRVTNSTPEAVFVEYGTEKMAAHRTLRTALDVLRER